jgi:Phosphotransferase enzyme family
VYRRSLAWRTAEENAASPVFQLFYHRLVGGRFDQFYRGSVVPLLERPWEEIEGLPWVINGRRFEKPLAALVSDAVRLLDPAQAGPTVVGHGDAHNGNVFYRGPDEQLLYFDPAFAGAHHPLLDLTKPLYHNTLAQWMYFPEEKGAALHLSAEIRDGAVVVEHDYAMNSLRQGILDSKKELVLRPIVAELAARKWLREDWREYLRAAVFCCPLLTMNLCDRGKFPANVSILGLAHAVMTGNEDL